jgi:hypothetical protein
MVDSGVYNTIRIGMPLPADIHLHIVQSSGKMTGSRAEHIVPDRTAPHPRCTFSSFSAQKPV